MIRILARCIAPIAALIGSPSLLAQTSFVVPSANATVEGNNSVSALNNSGQTYQFVFGASNISFPVGTVITSLSYRQDGGQSSGPSGDRTISNYEITLSPSNNAPGSLSTTFADNIGAGAVMVHSGAVNLTANSFQGGASPNAFGPAITFQTPYTYTGGDLLFTVSHTGTGNENIILDAQSNSVATPVQLIFSNGFGTSTGASMDLAPIVQLGTAPVPEPSVVLLLAAPCLAGGRLAARLKRRRATRSTSPACSATV
jgi:hypothetical protein